MHTHTRTIHPKHGPQMFGIGVSTNLDPGPGTFGSPNLNTDTKSKIWAESNETRKQFHSWLYRPWNTGIATSNFTTEQNILLTDRDPRQKEGTKKNQRYKETKQNGSENYYR